MLVSHIYFKPGLVLCLIIGLIISASACSKGSATVANGKGESSEIHDCCDNPLEPPTIERTSSAPELKEGLPTPANLKGQYALSQIAGIYGISLKVIAEAFMVPSSLSINYRSADLQFAYPDLVLRKTPINNQSVIMFVSLYKGIPFTPIEPTYLLEPGTNILKALGTLDLEELSYIESHTIKQKEIGSVVWEEIDESTCNVSSSSKITAKTTFQQALNLGIPLESLLNVVGAEEIDDLNQVISEYCGDDSCSFCTVSKDLTELIPVD